MAGKSKSPQRSSSASPKKKAAPAMTSADPYSPQGSLLFIHVLSPFYDLVVRFYPKWFVPNYITLFGIACTIIASIMLLVGLPNKYDANTLLIAGALNLIYVVADNTDGRQARNTRQLSNIGEYLDHGLDCATSYVSTWLMPAVVEYHSISDMAVGLTIININLCHHIHFTNKVMIFGNAFASVDEGMLMFTILPLLYGFFPGCLKTAVYGSTTLLELAPYAFLLLQGSVMVMYVMMSWRSVVNITTLGVVSTIAFMQLTASPYFAAQFPALGLTMWKTAPVPPACRCLAISLGCAVFSHVNIAGKCRRLRRLPVEQCLLAIPVLLLPFNPVLSCLLLLMGHVSQILFNIAMIEQQM